jgi:hypothetical protein
VILGNIVTATGEEKAMSMDPTRPLPTDRQNPRHGAPVYTKRRRRFPTKTLITLVVLLLLLFGVDRVARVITQNELASQVQKSMTLSGKPSVNIEGFPFLTQVLGRNLHTVVITGHNLTDGKLDFASIDITAKNIHINGTHSATVGSLTGTVTATFTSVAGAAGLPGSITLTPDGLDTVKATASILGVSDSVEAKVSPQGTDKIFVQLLNPGVLASVLGASTDFSVTVPGLPSGVSINSVTVTSGGLQVSFSGTDTTFSQLCIASGQSS